MLDRIDHVVIAVRDLQAASATYGRLFGRRPSWQGTHPQAGTANTLFRIGDLYVELIAVEGEGSFAPRVRDWIDRCGEGIFALAFATSDPEACAQTLRERGLHAEGPIDGAGRERTTGVERRWRNVFLTPEDTRGVTLFAIEHRSAAELLPVAEPTGAAAAVVSGIDHVVVHSADPEASIALYRDGLGLRLALDRTFEQWGMRLLFFRIAGVTVEIAHPLQGTTPDTPDRLWGISWQVGEVDAARARLAGEGFDVSEVRTGRRPATRVFTVRAETHGVATLVLGPGRGQVLHRASAG